MATFNGTNLHDLIDGTTLDDFIFGRGGDDTLRGGGGNDVIRAGSGTDILEGGLGNDRLFADIGPSSLFGGEGSDILVSGTGSDLLNGGDGIDLASYEQANGRVVLDLTTGRGFHGNSIDSLVQIENLLGGDFDDVLSGDAGANDLYGGRGNDNLSGLGGNDRVYGQDGNDELAGGSGNDRFIFEASNIFGKGQRPFDSGHDMILDFSLADKIDLSRHADATTFAALRAGARQVGEDAVITLGEDTITLDNFQAAELIPSMFLF